MLEPPPEAGTTASREEDREAAFARMVREHASLLYRVAHTVLRHPQDAEDAVQDALLKLFRGESWRVLREERAFLARVVWRSALDRRTARMTLAEDGAELRVIDLRPTPEQASADDDERRLLHELIDQLPDELREPLVLSALQELSSREVGEVMGLPEGTVRTRLMRARAELKTKFNALQPVGREVAAGERSLR